MKSLLSYEQAPLNKVKASHEVDRPRMELAAFEAVEAVFSKASGQDRMQVLVRVLSDMQSVELTAEALSPL